MQFVRVFCLLAASALAGSCAKVVVVKVDGATPAEGMIYALPNTVVRLQIKLDRTEKSGARYAPFAAIFAPGGKPVCKDIECTAETKVTYSLQEGTTLATYGEPDPANVYLVKFAGGGAVDQTMSMTWNEAGLLSSAGSSVTNRTTDIVTSGLKLLAGLGTKGAFGAVAVTTEAGKEACTDDAADADAWVIPILRDKGGEASVQLINNYCEVKAADRNGLLKNPTLLERATLAYVARIAPLVRARILMLSGTSTSMEPASLLTKIEAEITQQLTNLYLGTKSVKTWEGTLDVRRIAEGEGQATDVLRVNPEKGFCVSNADVPPDAKAIPEGLVRLAADSHDCAAGSPVKLQFAYHPTRDVQLFSKITDVTTGERSFRYRVPAQMSATIEDDKRVYGAGVLWIAQLGAVISLPAERRSKTLSYDLAFVEATGGLKSFKLGSTGGLDSGTVDALNSVGGTLLDYEKARKVGEDELTVLTREAALLKLRDEICTIQKKYGLTCTDEPK